MRGVFASGPRVFRAKYEQVTTKYAKCAKEFDCSTLVGRYVMIQPMPRAGVLLVVSLLLAAVNGVASVSNAAEGEGSEAGPARVLIAYYSLSGNTKAMAEAVMEGAKKVAAVEVVAKSVEQVTKEDLAAADGIILGAPTYYANIPGRMKVAIDDWSWKMKVDFTDKVGGAFATGGGQTGGKEHVVVSLLLFMVNNRMIVAGPLYEDAEGADKWAEIGSTAATGPTDPGVEGADIDGARRLGERIAKLAVKLRPAR
jgi:NAD(P)H dehydrogenase (quinone)